MEGLFGFSKTGPNLDLLTLQVSALGFATETHLWHGERRLPYHRWPPAKQVFFWGGG